LDRIIDHENLLAVYRQMEHEAGQAPGADGIRFGDLGRSERADVLRAVSRELSAGTYCPGPPRYRDVPKDAGGTRRLTIRSAVDRTVSRAVLIGIEPVLDARMNECSMGFRPRRSIYHLLAALEAAVISQGRWFVGTDDVRKAFDNVVVADAVRAFRRHIPDEATVQLIETILRGNDGAARRFGVDQGDPLSPLALNLLLDQVLDRPLTAAHPGTPYWRYADNLVWASQYVSEGRDLLQQAHQLLDATGLVFRQSSIDG